MIFWLTIGYLFITCVAILFTEPFFKKATPQNVTTNALFYAFGWPLLLLFVVFQIVFAIMLGIFKLMFTLIVFLLGLKQ